MPRHARIRGEFSTYHIIQRGNERKEIFLNDSDREKFIETLCRMKEKYNFKLEAYCLMNNHVHLIINDNGNDISKIVKSINISYAYYFNKTYERTGHLFQDRFRSEIIQNDNYLLQASAYIHNNPLKAGIVNSPEEYKWSSFNNYIGRVYTNFVDTDRILGIFSRSKQKAVNAYYSYVLKYIPGVDMLDVEEDIIQTKKDYSEYIDSYETAEKYVNGFLACNAINTQELKNNKDIRKELIKKLRKNSNLQLKEIGELAGKISPSAVCKILKS